MNKQVEHQLKTELVQALQAVYQISAHDHELTIEPTRSDFEGDYTFVVFPYIKAARTSPETLATAIGSHLIQHGLTVTQFNVVKGFLNLTLHTQVWLDALASAAVQTNYGAAELRHQKVLIEYSSPNTNKPLHLGHIRNNLLGYSIAEVLKKAGYTVFTCNLINDRGIHICKSMHAWMYFGNGETPESSGMKGDHLVGKYYVIFDTEYKKEINALVAQGKSEEEAKKIAPSILKAQELLRKWEAGDEETIQVWKTMNGWVYDGFESTYKKLGVSFDKYYYESNTYLLGKDIVQQGLNKGVFYKKTDGSVWVDLTDDGLDHKLLLRGDGTSVYITQDIGTAELKFTDFGCERSVYVVGNEQDYHFKVLQLICRKLGRPYADGIYHMSYGMVELPEGKMKSREGTVVDADDLMHDMVLTAEETTLALGKTQGLEAGELTQLYEIIGMGALKYFLLKVDPRKKMLFNPAESIDFHGNTGPFIQYTYARIRSILRTVGDFNVQKIAAADIHPTERQLIKILGQYPIVVEEAAREMSPAVIANYSYDVAKAFNQFYHECPIVREPNEQTRHIRLILCRLTGYVVQDAFSLLGINVPERM
jgi:arginyl-tRNA synthetase